MLIRYGWHGIGALTALVYDDQEQRDYREYVGNHLWAIANAMYSFAGKEIPTKPYSEILRPEIVDNRSGAEIREELLRKLGA